MMILMLYEIFIEIFIMYVLCECGVSVMRIIQLLLIMRKQINGGLLCEYRPQYRYTFV